MAALQGSVESDLAERFRVERELGRGGWGIVYLAHDFALERQVAVKVLREELSTGLARERFIREIALATRLTHPHLVAILESGEINGRLFCVMPYIAGESLANLLKRERQLPVARAISIAQNVADALHYVHEHGVVHRDIKPANILLDGHHALLTDFGISRALGHSADLESLTLSGVQIGTPTYMSPEQGSADRVDARSDVYSLACVLYEMLAGDPPFTGPTATAIAARHAVDPVPPLRTVRRVVPAHVESAILRALEKVPADRFASAGDFSRALSDEHETGGRRDGVSRKRIARYRWLIASAVAATVVVATGTWHVVAASGGALGPRDWILVADFEGPEQDPGVGDAVRDLATAELNQSRVLSTLPRPQLNATMRLAGVPETTRVGPQLARELAFRSSVRAVLLGSVKRLGATDYSIVLHAVRATDGSDILSVAGAASEANLVGTVQRLAHDLREGLGERRSAIDAAAPLEQIATPSFPAYRKYAEALSLLRTRGDTRGSNRLLREAIALDTAFASAWMAMGTNYLNERTLDSARWAFSRARALKDRLSELQRYRLEADAAYTLEYDIAGAIHAYDLYLAASPRSWSVHNARGSYMLALGRYEDALQSFANAVSSHPFGPRQAQIQGMNQTATLIALGRHREANRVARELSGSFAQYVTLMGLAATDRWSQAGSVASSVAADPSSPVWLRVQATAITAASQAARGAIRAADATLASTEMPVSPDVQRWLGRGRLLLSAASGQRVPEIPAALATDTTPPGMITSGIWAAMAGDTAEARARLSKLKRIPLDEQRRLGYGPLLLEASIAARGEQWERVSTILTTPATAGEHDTQLLDRVGSLSLRWLAADALAHRGRLDSAAFMLELAIKPQRMPGSEFAMRGLIVPFAHERLATWYMAAGERAAAARHWRLFLASVADPDPEMEARISGARAAIRRLQ